MSNELNVSTAAFGTIDPGVIITFYLPGTRQSYDTDRKRARFFSISADPELFRLELGGQHVDLEILRTWNTVWDGTEFNQNGGFDHVFQSNVEFQNIGSYSTGFELLKAETDN